nr:putative gamma-thionin [Tanacetum cinerariifolium]
MVASTKGTNKLCERRSTTWSGFCGVSKHCDQQCREWEKAAHGACHRQGLGMAKNTKFAKQSILGKPPMLGDIHVVSKPVTLNSVLTPQESKVMKNDKVIALGMFRINPFKTSREEKHVPNTVRASARTKPITVSQPPVITKKYVNSDSNEHQYHFSPTTTSDTTTTEPTTTTTTTHHITHHHSPPPQLIPPPPPPPLLAESTCRVHIRFVPSPQPSEGDIGETSNEPTQATRNEFEELYASANEELYPGCDYVTRLDFLAKFTYFKVK